MNDATPHTPVAATQVLAARVAQALTAGHVPAGQLLRVEVPVEGLEPLSWLRIQRDCTHYYWRDRDGVFAMAGVGEADVLKPTETDEPTETIFRRMRARLSECYPSLRYYGGFRFRRGTGDSRGERWQKFTDYRFIVPRFEVLKRRRGTVIACNVMCGDAEHNARELDCLLAGLVRLRFRRETPPAEAPQVLAREDHPDAEGWAARVNLALAEFAAGRMQKAVLARETVFTMAETIDPIALTARLAAASPRSYEFCFHPVADRAFIGASPERLFHRRSVLVESEALAGTRPRGKSDEEDLELGEALLHAEKDRAEHEFVVGMLRGHLREVCVDVEVPEAPRIKRLRHVQHLFTPVQGILRDTRDADARLLDALHPTPAVGGTPRDAALAWLDQHEPFDRGIYAGPVGWVGFDDAEFCVAIRSGLVQDKTLAVYTGAGILPGSVPADEWAEIEAKMASFMDALHAEALPPHEA